MDLLEQLLDNSYSGTVELLVNNKVITLQKYSTLPINDKIYFLLLPLEQIEGMDENELIILYITRSDFTLKMVSEKEEFKLILNYYEKLINRDN